MDEDGQGGADGVTQLRLYVREHCHLCTDMAAELAACADARQLRVTLVDVDGDDRLRAAFGHKVPVLTLGSYEICHYFLDLDALDAALTNRDLRP